MKSSIRNMRLLFISVWDNVYFIGLGSFKKVVLNGKIQDMYFIFYMYFLHGYMNKEALLFTHSKVLQSLFCSLVFMSERPKIQT